MRKPARWLVQAGQGQRHPPRPARAGNRHSAGRATAAMPCIHTTEREEMTPCMGGWCRIRNRCRNYAAAAPGVEPAERLCVPGHDGILNLIAPVDNPLPAAQSEEIIVDDLTWLFPTASPAETPADALSPAGDPPLPRNPATTKVNATRVEAAPRNKGNGYPTQVVRPAGTWEKSAARWMAPAQPFDLLGAA